MFVWLAIRCQEFMRGARALVAALDPRTGTLPGPGTMEMFQDEMDRQQEQTRSAEVLKHDVEKTLDERSSSQLAQLRACLHEAYREGLGPFGAKGKPGVTGATAFIEMVEARRFMVTAAASAETRAAAPAASESEAQSDLCRRLNEMDQRKASAQAWNDHTFATALNLRHWDIEDEEERALYQQRVEEVRLMFTAVMPDAIRRVCGYGVD